VIESLEDFALKREPHTLFLISIYHFFERKEVSRHTLVPHQVNCAKTALAKQFFYDIPISDHCPDGKSRLQFLHWTPHYM
jgi:hypothetical protein